MGSVKHGKARVQSDIVPTRDVDGPRTEPAAAVGLEAYSRDVHPRIRTVFTESPLWSVSLEVDRADVCRRLRERRGVIEEVSSRLLRVKGRSEKRHHDENQKRSGQ